MMKPLRHVLDPAVSTHALLVKPPDDQVDDGPVDRFGPPLKSTEEQVKMPHDYGVDPVQTS